jgi:hypothetical protein
MPNITRTLADTAGFVPQVWAARALDVLRENIVLTRRVARDSDFEPGWVGKTLNIPYPGTFTAQDKAADTPVNPQTPAGGNTVQVTLSKHKVVDFLVEDFAAAQTNTALLDRYVRPAAIALGNAMENDLFALYTSLTGGSVGTSGTDITAATVRSARKLLNDNKAPLVDRTLVVSDKDEIALLGDSSLQNYFAFSRQQGIAEGSIGRLYGFDVFVSQLVPVVTGTPNSTKNLAFHRDAMILAVRPFREPPAGSGVQAAVMPDPETGLVLRVLYQYDMSNRGVRVGLDILYGVAVLRPTLGVVVLS